MSSPSQETKQDGITIPIKEEWDYSPHIDGKTNYCHVTRIKEQELITDFLIRKSEGALLISGRRGVGKTSSVFAAIQEANKFLENKNKEKENKEKENKKTQMEIFAILVNAPNFEVRKIRQEQKNNISEQIDFLEFKRIVLQNLVRRLYEVAVKKEIIQISDERAINQSKINILKIFSRKKEYVSREENTPHARLSDHQQNDLDDIKKKISNLFRRTVAKEVRSETSLKELEQERYHLQKERSLELTGNLFGTTIAVSSFIAVAVAIFPITGIEELNRILPAVIGIVPPAAISWKVKKTTEDQTEAERKASTYYLYDYDLGTLQSELEETLLKLKQNDYKKYKVVFVIDELDKVDENDVIEVIKSLKSLFNQGSALFVLVTGNEFYNSLLERSKARGKEYTLFPQRIFLMRPQSQEITKFMDKIIDMDNNKPQQECLDLLFDFEDNKIPNDQSKTVELEKFLQSNRVYKSDVHTIKVAKITKENDDSISITFEESSINLKRDNEQPTATLVDRYNNKYDFSVLKKDGRYQVYVRANQYRTFQNYALYKARSDFFDLYNVLRDRIVYSDSKLELKIGLDKKQEMQANLQEILGINYSKQAYSELSDWHKNEQLLDLMYELIVTLGERIGNARIVRVEKMPKFKIIFFNDKNEKISQIPSEKGKKGLGEWFTGTANEDNTLTDVEKNALTVLIETMIKNKFLNAIEITTQYEQYDVTGILEGTTETLSPAEKAFLDEYKWLLNIMSGYVDVYIAYTKDETAEALFNRAKTEQDLKSILDIELIKEVTSTSMLLSNKVYFNTTYAGLRSVQKVRFPREELEEKTKMVRDTRNEVIRNFVLLLRNIIDHNKKASIYPDSLSTERFTVTDLQEKLGTKFTLTSEGASERTLDIPNLLIEYNIKTELRQLLVIQNPPLGVRDEIQKIKKIELYALFLTTNSAVIEGVQKNGERTGGKSNVFQQEDIPVWESPLFRIANSKVRTVRFLMQWIQLFRGSLLHSHMRRALRPLSYRNMTRPVNFSKKV